MREMPLIGSGTLDLPGALTVASRDWESHCFAGACALQLESSDLASAVEDMTWKIPA